MKVKLQSKRETMNLEMKSLVDEDTTLREMLKVEEKYEPLLTLLEQFSPGEDDKQFKRKLRKFEDSVYSMCPDETQLKQAFATFRAAALLNAATARKLAAVGASFSKQNKRQRPLRAAMLTVVLQGTFSKLDDLERSRPMFLINAANLMGDYFSEARKVNFLASPLLEYMHALLGSDAFRAQRSLLTQLMQNRRKLHLVLAQELEQLSISIHQRLLLSPVCRNIWLVLLAKIRLAERPVRKDDEKRKYKGRSTSRKTDGRPARINRRSSGEEEGRLAKTPPRYITYQLLWDFEFDFQWKKY